MNLPCALIRGRYKAAGLISFSLKNSIAFNTAWTYRREICDAGVTFEGLCTDILRVATRQTVADTTHWIGRSQSALKHFIRGRGKGAKGGGVAKH